MCVVHVDSYPIPSSYADKVRPFVLMEQSYELFIQ